jgi:Uma2 family endonuclease
VQSGLGRILTYSDYLAIPDDGKRREILAGSLIVTPAPRPMHQRVVRRMTTILDAYFGGAAKGEVFAAPIDLVLTEHDVLQPDLLVVDNRAWITDRGIEGPPLLVVEVLSKATAAHDRGPKLQRYAELGVRHHWLVDPDRRRIECRRLAGSVYERTISANGDSILAVPEFDDLRIPLASLWAESEAPERN